MDIYPEPKELSWELVGKLTEKIKRLQAENKSLAHERDTWFAKAGEFSGKIELLTTENEKLHKMLEETDQGARERFAEYRAKEALQQINGEGNANS